MYPTNHHKIILFFCIFAGSINTENGDVIFIYIVSLLLLILFLVFLYYHCLSFFHCLSKHEYASCANTLDYLFFVLCIFHNICRRLYPSRFVGGSSTFVDVYLFYKWLIGRFNSLPWTTKIFCQGLPPSLSFSSFKVPWPSYVTYITYSL